MQLDLVDASLLPLGMELRQVRWIGEEGEDRLNAVGKPLSRAKTVSHLSGKLLKIGYRTEILI
jgi:hypothetical protein